MDDERIDALLRERFAAPTRAPDDAFVARMRRAAIAEQRIAAARTRALRRFAVEAIASLAVAATFVLLGRRSPLDLNLAAEAISPAAVAALVLALWFAVELRPAAIER